MALMTLQCVMQPASAKPDFSVVVSGTSDNNDGRTLDADQQPSTWRTSSWKRGTARLITDYNIGVGAIAAA